MTKIYGLALVKGLRSPFLAKDETTNDATTNTTNKPAVPDRLRETVDELVKQKLDEIFKRKKPATDPAKKVEPTKPEPKSEEPAKKEEPKKPVEAPKTESKPKTEPKPAAVVKVEIDGLQQRLIEAPVSPGNYKNLACSGKYLFWTSTPTGFKTKASLLRVEISSKHPSGMVVEDTSDYQLTMDRKKIMVRKGDAFFAFASGWSHTRAAE